MRGLGAVVAAGGLVIVGMPAIAAEHMSRRVDLAAGPLRQQLIALSQSEGEQIILSEPIPAGIRAPRVKGWLTIDAALRRMLDGSGYVSRRLADGVIVIAGVPKEAPPPNVTPPVRPVAVLPQSPPPAVIDRIKDIIVTAQRTDERAQNVPLSLTALNAQIIADRRVQSAGDLVGSAPNLTLRPISGINFITTLRGVTAGGLTNQTLDGGVSIYIDGVYIGRGFQAVSNITDLERVEVLRGPQGTLFGRNATGGAVSFVTKNPAAAFGGSVEATIGDYAERGGRITINSGEWNGLSARISYVHDQRDGFVRNLAAGTVTTFLPSGEHTLAGATTDLSSRPLTVTAQSTMGAGASDTLLATLQFANGPVTIDYKLDHANTRYTQPLYQIAGFTGLAPFSATMGGLVLSPQSRISDAPRRMTEAAADLDGLNTIRTLGHNLTTQIALGAGLTLKSISAYRWLDTFSISDLDGSDLVAAGPMPSPYTLVAQIAPRRQNQLSTEFQLLGKSAALDWIIGGFYYREHTFEQPVTFAYTRLDQGRTYITTVADYGATNSYSRAGDRSLALYGHMAWHLLDGFDLSGGLRLSRDRKSITLLGDCFFPNALLDDPVAARSDVDARLVYCVPHAASEPGLRSDRGTRAYTSLDWDVSATYTIASDVKVYLRAASGFQSGGFLNFYDFLPEKMVSLEVGWKAELMDHRLRVDGALFATHRNNAQQATYYGPNVGSHIDNLELNTRGGEIEVAAVPVRGLTLEVSAGFTHVGAANGERQAVPRWTLLGQLQYAFPRGASGAYVLVRLDGNWTSCITPAMPVPTYPGTTSVFGGSVDQALTIPAQWTVNGRLEIADATLGGGMKAHAALWVKNLLNDASVNFGSDFVTVALVTYKPPRTIGFDIGLDF